MSNTNNRSRSYKDYEASHRSGFFCEEQSRKCNQCGKATVVAYNLRTHEVETFNLDDNYPIQRIKHRHPADNITKASVVSAIAVEKRYLFERRPGDYDPLSRRIIK